MKARILASIFVACALAFILWHVDLTSVTRDSGLSDAPHMLRWRPDTTQQYHLSIDSSMQMRGDTGTPAQSIRVQMDATLNFMTLSADQQANSALVGMQLSDVDLITSGHRDAETSRLLESPFRVRFVRGGVPAAFEYPAELGTQERKMLEATIRKLQVTLDNSYASSKDNSNTKANDSWTAREEHSSGAYLASYQRTSPTRLTKSKDTFLASPSSPLLRDATISSEESITVSPSSDWITAMSVDETLQSESFGNIAITIRDNYEIKLVSDSIAHTSDQLWKFTAAQAPADISSEKDALPDITPEEAYNKILATINELDRISNSSPKLIHQLRDLLQVDSTLPARLLQILQTQSLKDRTRADLYLALELAGNAPAQGALSAVLNNDQWPAKDAMRAMVALGDVNRPNQESVSALWLVAETPATAANGRQLASTAVFALGSIGKTLRNTDDAAYFALRSRLLQGMNNSAATGFETDRRANYVIALGNTHDASLSPEITPLLQDNSATVRRAAALALGQLGADSSAEPLLTRFNQESSQQVRGAIMESLVKWSSPTESAMTDIRNSVRNEPDENTRYQMARFLTENLAKYPENEAVLKTLLRYETSGRTRQAVAEALADHKQMKRNEET